MGSGAGVLRLGTGMYHLTLRHGMGLHLPNHHTHITVMRQVYWVPVELEEASSTSSDDDYDYEPSEGAYEDDYDYQNELESIRYLNGGADIRYRW